MHQKNICVACTKAIGNEKFWTVHNKHIHDKCFVCESCKASLAKSYFKYKSKLLCGGCYKIELAKTAPKCFVCRQPMIDGEIVEINGRSYHENCLTCHECKTAIKGNQYYPTNDGLYCNSCQAKRFPVENVMVRTSSCLEEIGRTMPAGVPLHKFPGQFNGFNEFDEKWYYFNTYHVIGVMVLFALTFALLYLTMTIWCIVEIAKKNPPFLFLLFLIGVLIMLTAPIQIYRAFDNISPEISRSLNTFLIAFTIVNASFGFLTLLILTLGSADRALVDNDMFSKLTWSSSGINTCFWIECFLACAVCWTCKLCNRRFHDYLSEKVLAKKGGLSKTASTETYTDTPSESKPKTTKTEHGAKQTKKKQKVDYISKF